MRLAQCKFVNWQSKNSGTKAALPTMKMPWRARVRATLIRFSTCRKLDPRHPGYRVNRILPLYCRRGFKLTPSKLSTARKPIWRALPVQGDSMKPFGGYVMSSQCEGLVVLLSDQIWTSALAMWTNQTCYQWSAHKSTLQYDWSCLDPASAFRNVAGLPTS